MRLAKGNLVRHKQTKEVFTVFEILNNVICIEWHIEQPKRKYIHISMCEPIPITEDILISAGFDVNNGYCYEDRFSLTLNGTWIAYIEDVLIKDIEFVHQLQNLYYELEDKELTFK